MKQVYSYQDKSFSIDLVRSGTSYQANFGDRMVDVQLIRVDGGRFDLLIDGQPISATVSQDGAKRWVTVQGQTLLLTKSGGTVRMNTHQVVPDGKIIAPMPGQVRAVHMVEGDGVTKGQILIIIEAMKMEIKITAQITGVVKKLLAKVGQTVEREQILAEINADDVGTKNE